MGIISFISTNLKKPNLYASASSHPIHISNQPNRPPLATPFSSIYLTLHPPHHIITGTPHAALTPPVMPLPLTTLILLLPPPLRRKRNLALAHDRGIRARPAVSTRSALRILERRHTRAKGAVPSRLRPPRRRRHHHLRTLLRPLATLLVRRRRDAAGVGGVDGGLFALGGLARGGGVVVGVGVGIRVGGAAVRVEFFALDGCEALGEAGLLLCAWVDGVELVRGFVDFEVFVFEEAGETRVVEDAGGFGCCGGGSVCGFSVFCDVGIDIDHVVVAAALEDTLGASALGFLLALLDLLGELAVDFDGDLFGAADAGFALFGDLVLDALLALFLPEVWVGDEAGLFVEFLRDEETVHVRAEQGRCADEVVEVEGAELLGGEELEVVVDVAASVFVEGVGVVGVFGHFFDEVVQEGTPFGGGAQLRDEEGVLLLALVGREEHAAVLAPLDVVEVDGGLDGGPVRAGFGVPDLDDALVGGEDLGFALRGRVEVDDVLDGVAVALVLCEERLGGAHVVEAGDAVGVANGDFETGAVKLQGGDFGAVRQGVVWCR